MKFFPLVLGCILAGCFYVGRDQYGEILNKPSSAWNNRDNLIALISPIADNLADRDNPNIKVFATPYYPAVVIAISRANQRLRHLSESQYEAYAEGLAKDALGMYIDWNKNEFVDSRGDYFKTPLQIDSLMFLVTIHNNGWPPTVIFGPVYNPVRKDYEMRLLAAGIYSPDITDLESNIFLVNDKNKYIKPRFVYGKQNSWLTLDETLFVKFVVRNGDHHFFEGSRNIYLVIKGFENDIKLTLPLSMIQCGSLPGEKEASH